MRAARMADADLAGALGAQSQAGAALSQMAGALDDHQQRQADQARVELAALLERVNRQLADQEALLAQVEQADTWAWDTWLPLQRVLKQTGQALAGDAQHLARQWPEDASSLSDAAEALDQAQDRQQRAEVALQNESQADALARQGEALVHLDQAAAQLGGLLGELDRKADVAQLDAIGDALLSLADQQAALRERLTPMVQSQRWRRRDWMRQDMAWRRQDVDGLGLLQRQQALIEGVNEAARMLGEEPAVVFHRTLEQVDAQMSQAAAQLLRRLVDPSLLGAQQQAENQLRRLAAGVAQRRQVRAKAPPEGGGGGGSGGSSGGKRRLLPQPAQLQVLHLMQSDLLARSEALTAADEAGRQLLMREQQALAELTEALLRSMEEGGGL